MNMNVIGGALGVAALVLIFSLHECSRTVSPKPVSAPAAQNVPARDQAAPVPLPRPRPTVGHDKRFYAPGKYRRVLPGGKLGGEVDCKYVPAIAKTVPPEQALAYAKKYGLSEAQLKTLSVCLK